jgi:hypothetical protein
MHAMVEQMGGEPEASPELKLLASAAVSASDARRNENVEQWAKTLANDVADAND